MKYGNNTYTGKIKWFNKKGFGIIELDESNDEIFVHHSNIVTKSTNFIILNEGEAVIFKIVFDHWIFAVVFS